MSIELVHIHGFKCAGTTLATLLANNYGPKFRCVESTHRAQRLPWCQVAHHPELKEIRVISSHTITPPIQSLNGPLIVGLVRNPSERLTSAWRFFQKQSNQPNFQFSDYLYRQRLLKNYQTRIYSPQIMGLSENVNLWSQNLDRIKLGHNYFLGVVERYAESLVVIQYLLQKRNIEFKLSVTNENVAKVSDFDVVQDVEIPEDYIQIDELLYRRCQNLLDSFREIIPSFEKRLEALNHSSGENLSGKNYQHLVRPENFLRIEVLR